MSSVIFSRRRCCGALGRVGFYRRTRTKLSLFGDFALSMWAASVGGGARHIFLLQVEGADDPHGFAKPGLGDQFVHRVAFKIKHKTSLENTRCCAPTCSSMVSRGISSANTQRVPFTSRSTRRSGCRQATNLTFALLPLQSAALVSGEASPFPEAVTLLASIFPLPTR